jgi:hypothetical protein
MRCIALKQAAPGRARRCASRASHCLSCRCMCVLRSAILTTLFIIGAA